MYQALGAPEQQNFIQPAMSAENSNAISPARKRPFSAYLCPEPVMRRMLFWASKRVRRLAGRDPPVFIAFMHEELSIDERSKPAV